MKCPRCGHQSFEKVPGVDTWHCDRCGNLGGSVLPDSEALPVLRAAAAENPSEYNVAMLVAAERLRTVSR